MYNDWFQQPWTAEMSKQFRYPGRVKFTMDVSPNIEHVDGALENALEGTDADTIVDGNCVSCPAANLEGLWRADGNAVLLSRDPAENSIAVWSAEAVSEEQPLVLSYEISEASIAGVALRWDATYRSWPTRFTLRAYDEDDSLLKELEVINSQPLSDPYEQVVEFPVDDMYRLDIIVTEWSKPNQRARISNMHFGLILALTEKQVVSISEQTQISPVGARLPADTHKYTIRNYVYKQMPASIEEIAAGDLHVQLPWRVPLSAYTDANPLKLQIYLEQPALVYLLQLGWGAGNTPSSIEVVGFDSFDRPVYSTRQPVAGASTVLQLPKQTVKSLEVTILEWSSSVSKLATLQSLSAMREYGNNSIPGEVNNLFDPSRLTGASKYLAQRQKISVQYGIDTYDDSTLWLPTQTRFLDAWNIPQDKMAVELQSSSRLSFLTSVFSKGVFGTASLRELAEGVLNDSSIIKDFPEQTPWILPDVLDECCTDAPLPMQAENVVLQLIAQAAGCIISSNPENSFVTITNTMQNELESWQDSPYIIDRSVQLQQPSITLETPLKRIQVYQYKYTAESTAEVIYSDTLPRGYGAFIYEFYYKGSICATNITVTATNATIVSQELYGYKARLLLQHASDTTDVVVTIKGCKVTSSKSLVTVYDDYEVESGKEVVVDNPLVTNADLVNRIGAAMLNFYTKRVQVKTKYLGYPDLKSSAQLVVYSDYANGFGHVVESKMEYNGAYSGDLTILMED